jgi:hypothetical protein
MAFLFIRGNEARTVICGYAIAIAIIAGSDNNGTKGVSAFFLTNNLLFSINNPILDRVWCITHIKPWTPYPLQSAIDSLPLRSTALGLYKHQ